MTGNRAASIAMACPSSEHETDAALQSLSDQAKAENLTVIAEMSGGADEAHVAAHIRGIVRAGQVLGRA